MELLELIKFIGMIYGVGASTFAVIFYYKALEDGKVDASEHNFIDTVFFMLRVGMVALIIVEVCLIVFAYRGGPSALPYLYSADLWVRLVILTLLNVNAILMDNKIVHWFLGTIILGGSWYAYFIISLWQPIGISFLSLITLYIAFVILFGVLLTGIRKLYLGKVTVDSVE